MHVQLFKGVGLQPWRFRLVGENGEPVAASEGYVTRRNALRGARKAFGRDIEIREPLKNRQ